MLKLITQQISKQLTQLKPGVNSLRCSSAALPSNTPVLNVLNGWTDKLKNAGIGDIDFNLKCIVAHVLQQKFSTLPDYSTLQMNAQQQQQFERLCEARCARMPLQYILGEWDFMDLTLKTAPTVFIPRPETEEFVLKVIEHYKDAKSVRMLEVGCGSGAISLAILHRLPQVQSVAIERSRAATKLAWENAKNLGYEKRFEVHNHTVQLEQLLPDALKHETFDLIVSNPPYVKTEEFQHLQPEVVVYENLNALDGGPDGLRIARLVLDVACEHLRVGGKLWMELGHEHPALMKTIINMNYAKHLRYVRGFKDQYKFERFVEIEKI